MRGRWPGEPPHRQNDLADPVRALVSVSESVFDFFEPRAEGAGHRDRARDLLEGAELVEGEATFPTTAASGLLTS